MIYHLNNQPELMKNMLLTLAIGLAITLRPIWPLLIIAVSVTAIDTIYGIYACFKLKGWRSFSSTKFFNLPVKILVYSGSISLSYFIDFHIFDGAISTVTLPLSKFATLFVIITEVTSLNETSIRLKNKSFWIVLRDFVLKVAGLKKDLKTVIEDMDNVTARDENDKLDDNFTNKLV